MELKALKENGVSFRLTLARAVTSIVSSPDTSSSASLNMDSSFAASNTMVRRAGGPNLQRKLCVDNLKAGHSSLFLSSVSPSPFPLFFSLCLFVSFSLSLSLFSDSDSLFLFACTWRKGVGGLMFTLARVLV